MDNFSAWRASVQAVAASSGQVQARHPRQALDKVLARYGAFLGASTSNVERSFAALLDAAGSRRSRLSTINMSNDLRLRLLEKNRPYEPLVDAARRIWSESFGMSRRSGKDRRRRSGCRCGEATSLTNGGPLSTCWSPPQENGHLQSSSCLLRSSRRARECCCAIVERAFAERRRGACQRVRQLTAKHHS